MVDRHEQETVIAQVTPGDERSVVGAPPAQKSVHRVQERPLLFSGEDTPVRDVIAGGAWVVRDGRHDRGEEVATRYRVVADRLRS